MTAGVWAAERTADVVLAARAWGTSEDLRQLVDELGGPATAPVDTLARWSAAVLDKRGGEERRDAPTAAWDDAQIRAVLRAAGPLGLLETAHPQRRAYDATLLLGGATTGNRLRTELAARLAGDGVDLGVLALVTADRRISRHEHETDPGSSQDATEWRHLLRMVQETFGRLKPLEHEGQFETADGRLIWLLVAPPSAPDGRANTADGIRFFLEHVAAGRVLLVTSAIYAPYQFFAVAPLLLEGGCPYVELVGTPTATDGDPQLLAQRLAQEIHAAITAVSALADLQD